MEAKNILNGKECVLFENLDDAKKRLISETRTLVHLKKGECLFSEGGSPTGVYCVHFGHLKGVKTGKDGKEQIIYLAKPGDLVGWQQVGCEDPYTTTTIALDKAIVSHIPKAIFLEATKDSPLSAAFARYICDDVIMLESKVLELSQKSVKERLVSNIVLLQEKYGENKDDTVLITIPLSREDYANLVGTNTETAIKMLSELRKEGYIDFIDKKILILNLNHLKRVAGL
ncbi:MAG: Crp/Fnr family transcriptional regulator [Cytophagaceae bacterium]